jgi:putative heme iron utilization protein
LNRQFQSARSGRFEMRFKLRECRARLVQRIVWRGIISRCSTTDATVDDLSSERREYLALRERCHGAMLATLEGDGTPAASYAPMVWLDGEAYLFLSDLAGHTRNLRRCSSLGVLLIEGENSSANAFARRRITLQGEARLVEREDPSFAPVLAEFHRRFGQVMTVLESLPDFYLFRLQLQRGRYIRGFGQAYELSGERLTQLVHINPGK